MTFENHERIIFIGDSVTDFGRKRPIGEGLHDGVGTGYVRCQYYLRSAPNVVRFFS